jgi:hypothetical protein
MAKFKIVSSEERNWLAPDGLNKTYRSCDLEGNAGQVIPGVSVWPTKAHPLSELRTGMEIEGEVDVSGRGKKFIFPKATSSFRSNPADDEKRSERIAFLASTERAVELVEILLDESIENPDSKEEVLSLVVELRDWFISEYKNNTK